MAPLRNKLHVATLLEECTATQAGVTIYTDGGATRMSYSEFHALVLRKANLSGLHQAIIPGNIVLIQFQSHLETLTWFWALTVVGCIPAMSTSLNENKETRASHSQRFNFLLHDPIFHTTRYLARSEFAQNDVSQVVTTEDIENLRYVEPVQQNPKDQLIDLSLKDSTDERFYETAKTSSYPEDVAVIMLTSGNTGLSKAVCLTYAQIFASLKGMMPSMPFPSGPALLNWTPLDQVSSLVEIHLYAMFAGPNQVHVPTASVQADPLMFLRMLSKHNVSRAFAPNSFLFKLQFVLDTASPEETQGIDIGDLMYIGSDGEADNANNCARISDILKRLKAENQKEANSNCHAIDG